jgi:hypothetical protein
MRALYQTGGLGVGLGVGSGARLGVGEWKGRVEGLGSGWQGFRSLELRGRPPFHYLRNEHDLITFDSNDCDKRTVLTVRGRTIPRYTIGRI